MASSIANFSNVSSSVLTLKGVGSLTGGGGEGIGRIKGNYQQAQKNPIREKNGKFCVKRRKIEDFA